MPDQVLLVDREELIAHDQPVPRHLTRRYVDGVRKTAPLLHLTRGHGGDDDDRAVLITNVVGDNYCWALASLCGSSGVTEIHLVDLAPPGKAPREVGHSGNGEIARSGFFGPTETSETGRTVSSR